MVAETEVLGGVQGFGYFVWCVVQCFWLRIWSPFLDVLIFIVTYHGGAGIKSCSWGGLGQCPCAYLDAGDALWSMEVSESAPRGATADVVCSISDKNSVSHCTATIIHTLYPF
jgi:hypothetical protein